MAGLRDEGLTFSSICTDPPYHLTNRVVDWDGFKDNSGRGRPILNRRDAKVGFMGKTWDGGDIAFRPDTWRLALDLLEPGGMMACFGGARTQHRMACAIEDAGFAIFDTALWLHSQGFPKAKSQLKPAYEPIVLARKPTKGPVRALNIDDCRIATTDNLNGGTYSPGAKNGEIYGGGLVRSAERQFVQPAGRWPANILHDGSDEVLDLFSAFGERQSRSGAKKANKASIGYGGSDGAFDTVGYGNDTGTAARFFYAAKASRAERAGSKHPTVKPLALMRWLVRLITPPGGAVLDPFAGSGTTGVACGLEGFGCVLVEREAEYVETIKARLGATFQLEAAD